MLVCMHVVEDISRSDIFQTLHSRELSLWAFMPVHEDLHTCQSTQPCKQLHRRIYICTDELSIMLSTVWAALTGIAFILNAIGDVCPPEVP